MRQHLTWQSPCDFTLNGFPRRYAKHREGREDVIYIRGAHYPVLADDIALHCKVYVSLEYTYASHAEINSVLQKKCTD